MPTSISQTFNDSTVLVTGFTGFLGKLLVEKLLRSCSVRTVAVIVRNKKGITAQQRVQDICEKDLFNRIRSEKPDFMNRIKVLDGCLEDPLLGLSSIDHDWTITNVNLIFHCAATIRFNEPLELAKKINIQGTEQLILLSTELKNLKGFVHVSTAYSHYPRKEINEENYPISNIDYNDMNSLLSDNKSSAKILGAWANSYTFTKAIAENILMTNENHLPISIFRPSIITCTQSEPEPGWLEGINGLAAMLTPIIIGLLRVAPISMNKKADIIPADYTVNALICVMWDTVNRYQKDTRQFLEVPTVFNYVSSVENPITWKEINKEVFHNYYRAPPLTSMWYSFFVCIDVRWAIIILRIFLHRIPALLTDLYLMVTGEKPKMLKMYTKMEYMTDLLHKFTSREWKFDNNNTRELWSSLSHEDRMTFMFSFEGFDWKLYMKIYYSGLRKYILGEDQSNIEEALAKNRRWFWIHYSCIITFIVLFVLQVFWIFTNYILRN